MEGAAVQCLCPFNAELRGLGSGRRVQGYSHSVGHCWPKQPKQREVYPHQAGTQDLVGKDRRVTGILRPASAVSQRPDCVTLLGQNVWDRLISRRATTTLSDIMSTNAKPIDQKKHGKLAPYISVVNPFKLSPTKCSFPQHANASEPLHNSSVTPVSNK